MKEIIEVADNDKDWVQQTNIVNGDNFSEENLDEKEERYNCTLCEASFIAKSSLGSHHSVVHEFEGEKSQECPLCNIKFSAYGKLQIHFMKEKSPGIRMNQILQQMRTRNAKILPIFRGNNGLNRHILCTERN